MGNSISTYLREHERMMKMLTDIKKEMLLFQNRLAGLEQDCGNLSVAINHSNKKLSDTLNMKFSLLEEGRSFYKPNKSHTASLYR